MPQLAGMTAMFTCVSALHVEKRSPEAMIVAAPTFILWAGCERMCEKLSSSGRVSAIEQRISTMMFRGRP